MFEVLKEASCLCHGPHAASGSWGTWDEKILEQKGRSWSISIKKVCVLNVCGEKSEVPITQKFLASFWEHWCLQSQVFVPESFAPSQAPTTLTTLSKMFSNSPEGLFSPSMGMVTLWLSSPEPGGSCSSRGAHALLVDLRISLLLFSWPPWELPDPCDLSAIVRE